MRLKRAMMAAAGLAFSGSIATAQVATQVPSTQGPGNQAQAAATGWQFSLTPYGWAPGLSGKIKTPLPRVGDQSFDVGAKSLLQGIETAPVMVAGEARYGRFGIIGDFFYVGIKSDINTRDVLFNGGHSYMLTNFGELAGVVRVVEGEKANLDIGAGFRVWSLSSKVSLNPGAISGAIQKTSFSWADPIFVARYAVQLSPRMGIGLYGDIGGFGSSTRVTWQGIASLDYAVTDSIAIKTGWRYLYFNRDRANAGLELGFNGPFIGATFRF